VAVTCRLNSTFWGTQIAMWPSASLVAEAPGMIPPSKPTAEAVAPAIGVIWAMSEMVEVM
jgi:hypothetical protein